MPEGLYIDEDGRVIVTNSMLKTFRRCPKQADYKYAQRLKPRVQNKNLRRGTWFHTLLQYYHLGQDWEVHHQKLKAVFDEMFDEEKDYYGDLPGEIERAMRAYIWHYKDDEWRVIDTEVTLEAALPDGTILRAKVDAIIENAFGVWIVDHKTHKQLPNLVFRILDAQSGLYLWIAGQMGLKVQGFIWNYVRWKAPSVPELVYRKTAHPRLSSRPCETDYPTYTKAVLAYKEEFPGFRVTPEIIAKQRLLKSQRYKHGAPQTSPFFRRDILEKDPDMLRRVAVENFHTSLRMNNYDFTEQEAVERNPDFSCERLCSYVALCSTELMGGDSRYLRKQLYTIGDPNDYYYDKEQDSVIQ